MRRAFEELSREATPAGLVTLRRRAEPTLGRDVFEVKLDDAFLMSSLFTAGEVALAELGLAPFAPDATDLHVVVGGMGLGYTANAARGDARVGDLVVVDAVDTVLGWHRDGLLPDVAGLADHPRTALRHDDVFTLVREGRLGGEDGAPVDAFLLDVDHTPTNLLHASHADLYTPDGLARLRAQLADDGVLALWSDTADDAFLATLADAFDEAEAHEVGFPNPLTGGTASNVVFVGRARS